MYKKIQRKDALKVINELIGTFKEKEAELLQESYKEDNVRKDFIDKFFKALGWDMYNDQRLPERQREVTHEDRVRIEGKPKAPDYGFRIGRKLMYYVEAKAPHVDLRKKKEPAYQVRLYGYNRKLPISILTDFQEFAIYDTKVPPKENDDPAVARVFYCPYEDYPKHFDTIYDWCSHDALLNSKSQYYKFLGQQIKKGQLPIDENFLSYLDNCRDVLAHEIANRNRALSLNEKNFNHLVQLILDRIIFLRIAEDRNIEKYSQLLAISEKTDIFSALQSIFAKSIQKYNSSLFEPSALLDSIEINDAALKRIIKGLYYPNPYEFSALSVEILGSIYERFLGNVIRVLPAGGVTIEKKPEVQKAGGVFYTPEYVVDHIVNKTLGLKIQDLSTDEVSKIRLLDPACGSGSFLIAAYDYLLNWHLSHYTKNQGLIQASLKKGLIYKYVMNASNPEETRVIFKLSIEEKKRILLNNIYGVDIDPQAVEVTKLSLILKMLEDENAETTDTLFHEIGKQILPDLSDNNVKVGNSLIQSDIFKNRQSLLFEKDKVERINCFDWASVGSTAQKPGKYTNRGFPEIMAEGGFDIIVGNPPWGAELSEPELEYCREKNKSIIVRMIDTFMYFTYHSINDLLKQKGEWGMILPDVVLYQKDNGRLRKYLIENFQLQEALNMGDVFEVKRPTAILIGTKESVEDYTIECADFSGFPKVEKPILIENFEPLHVSTTQVKNSHDFLFLTRNLDHHSILDDIKLRITTTVGDIADKDGIQRGVSPDLKEAFIVSSATIKRHKLEKIKLRPTVTGGTQIKRFHTIKDDQFVIYTTRDDDFKKYPNICEYIKSYKNQITCSEVRDGKHPLYSLHRPRKEAIFTKPKLIGVITEDEIIVDYDTDNLYVSDGAYLFGVSNMINPYFAMGVLNSNLFIFLYRLYAIEEGRMLSQVKPTIIAKMPFLIPTISEQENIAKLAEELKKLTKIQYESVKNTESDAKHLALIKKQLDGAVYELYGIQEHAPFIEATLV